RAPPYRLRLSGSPAVSTPERPAKLALWRAQTTQGNEGSRFRPRCPSARTDGRAGSTAAHAFRRAATARGLGKGVVMRLRIAVARRAAGFSRRSPQAARARLHRRRPARMGDTDAVRDAQRARGDTDG